MQYGAYDEERPTLGRLHLETNIHRTYLLLIGLQATHAIEEYTQRFYERFPPAVFLKARIPGISNVGFTAFNITLLCLGLLGYFVWVMREKPFARQIIWIWVGIELYNGIAHLIWAVLIRGYNPGLISATALLLASTFLGYSLHQTRRSQNI